MKKAILISTLALISLSLFSCSMEVSVNGKEYSAGKKKTETAQSADSKAITENSNNETQKEPAPENEPEETKASSEEKKTTEASAKNDAKTTKSTEPSASAKKSDIVSPFENLDFSESFSLGTNGVKINSDINQDDDKDLISVATDLYKLACDTEWNYHVGCPYDIDTNSTIESDFGWQYYLITDPSISTFSDVEKDYYKVFSESYGNDLDELFIEKNGNVYALAGDRGADIYYKGFKVTGVAAKSSTEILFNVENYYADNADDNYTVPVDECTFSIVRKGESWRVGKFSLPY